MRILTKYMIREFLKPFTGTATIFLTLFILSEAFRIINIDNKTENSLAFLPLYLLYQSPLWLIQIIPFALLLAFLFSYNNLVRQNEVTAIKAGGVNINALFKPLIIISVLVSIFVITVNEKIIPFTNKQSEHFYRIKILGNTPSTHKVYTNISYLGDNGRKILIKRFDASTNTLEKVTVDTFNKKLRLTEQTYAKKALWNDADNMWFFEDGVTRSFDPEKHTILSEKVFNKKGIPMTEVPDDFKTERKNPNQMTIKELKKYITRLKRNSIPVFRELSQFHLKFAFPFANMIVILIGIAFASSNVKGNKIISFAVSLTISFLYWGLTSVGVALGENRVLPPFFAAWAPNILFALSSLYFIRKLKR